MLLCAFDLVGHIQEWTDRATTGEDIYIKTMISMELVCNNLLFYSTLKLYTLFNGVFARLLYIHKL